MRLIDADKLHREEIDYFLGYSIQQIENAPTVCDIEQIRAEIEQSRYCLVNDGLDLALKIIDKYTKGE